MSLKDNINRLFQRDSINSNIATSRNKVYSRYSLNIKGERIPYKKGLEIMEDTQVSTGFDILKYLLSSKQWVLLNSPNDMDNTVYDFINNMLQSMDTEVNEIVKQTCNAILWGFNIHELIYDVDENGKLYVKNMVPIHIKTLQHDPFTYDDDGELVSIHQEFNGEYVDIPVSKVLKYSFNSKYDEDYGHGLLLDFRHIVEDKVNINNWLMTFLEKHENPVLYGKTGSSVTRDALLDAFEDVRDGTTGLTIGPEDEVGVLESSHRGETFFKTLQYKDNQIFRRYYLGNLLLGDNSQTGTYAQSTTQLEFGQLIFDGLLEEIANCIQSQVITPLVNMNYGDVNLAPTFGFDKFTSGDLHALMNTIKPLIDSGIIDSENDTVHDSIKLLFKQETGLDYEDTTPEVVEDYSNPDDELSLDETQDILDELTF